MRPALRPLRQLLAERPRRDDAALALLVVALTVAPLIGAHPLPGWAYLLVLAECLPLLWRRVAPFAVALSVGVLTIVHSLGSIPEPVLPWASLVAVYGVAAHAARRLALLSAGLLAVLLPPTLLLDARPLTFESIVASTVVYAAAWLLGDAARHRRDRAALLEQQAIDAERSRMAGEMHDSLGHHLSLVIVQAEAGPALLDRSPDAAVKAFDAISDSARRCLTELRQVLGTLHGIQPAEREPAQGVAALPGLLSSVRRSGVAVEHAVTGTAVPLSPAGDRAAFRVVQEALTNVIRHAEAPAAAVSLHYTRDAVEISVRNGGGAGRSGRPGHGLIGMRERIASVGGQFTAGPAPGGGWQVRAVIPIRDAP